MKLVVEEEAVEQDWEFHPGAFISTLIFTNELFDEELTREELEGEIARLVGISDQDVLSCIQERLLADGCNVATNIIVFSYWLFGSCPLVTPILKWHGGYYRLPSFVPLAEDLRLVGRREAVIMLPLTVDAPRFRKRYSMAPNWCDELVVAQMDRRLSFGVRIGGKSLAWCNSYNLATRWAWVGSPSNTYQTIGVVLDPDALFLKNDLARCASLFEAICAQGQFVSERELRLWPGLLTCSSDGDYNIRVNDTLRIGGNVDMKVSLPVKDDRTPRDIVLALETAMNSRRDIVAQMERETLWRKRSL